MRMNDLEDVTGSVVRQAVACSARQLNENISAIEKNNQLLREWNIKKRNEKMKIMTILK